MASHDGGGPLAASRTVHELSDSESGSSYMGSEASHSAQNACPWRTARFHDQECSRFFDCPEHTVERSLSDIGADSDDERHQDEHDEDVEMEHGGRIIDVDEEGGEDRRERQPSHITIEDSPSPPPTVVLSPPSAPGEALDPLSGFSSGESSARAASGQSGRGTEMDPIVLDEAASPVGSPQPSSSAVPVPARQSDNMFASYTSQIPVPARAASGHISIQSSSPEPAHPAPSFPGEPVAAPPPSAATTSQPRPPLEIVLPRWQPDAEVTYCPICRTQFSIFVRKHHCRKCGRVVCNSCSPHRITIPYQYIVQPPGMPRLGPPQRYSSTFGGSEDGDGADVSSLGGGERVRLCNPCVPDPNTAPPQAPESPALRTHSRSQSNNFSGQYQPQPQQTSPASNRWSSYFGAAPSPADAYARSRSVTMQTGAPRPPSNPYYVQGSTQNRIMAGTPPAYYPGAPSSASTASQRHQPYPPVGLRHRSMLDVAGPSSSSSQTAAVNRRLPPLPMLVPPDQLPAQFQPPQQYQQPQIAEEDECPVCHRELPSRTLPNFEAQRESHIASCIVTHSAYGSAPRSGGGGGVFNDNNANARPVASPPRRTGMFPYYATEKDCVDSAECSICLEEFEVGVPMARLECLCRFHRRCIGAWWERHPGRCPMHQHDGYGF